MKVLFTGFKRVSGKSKTTNKDYDFLAVDYVKPYGDFGGYGYTTYKSSKNAGVYGGALTGEQFEKTYSSVKFPVIADFYFSDSGKVEDIQI